MFLTENLNSSIISNMYKLAGIDVNFFCFYFQTILFHIITETSYQKLGMRELFDFFWWFFLF